MGSIALLDQDGILIAGDAVHEGVLVDNLPHSDRAAYRTTMQRLDALPVCRGHGGHNAAFAVGRLREMAWDYLGAG